MKAIIQIVLAALLVNASWRAGSAYFRYYRFTDRVQEAALFGTSKSDGELQARVADLANEIGLPLPPESITVRRTQNHTLITAAYTEPVQIVPNYEYPYEFKLNVDVLTIAGAGSIAPVR